MTRNGGAIIDVQEKRVRDRNGVWYPLDTLAVADDGVYYARPIEGNDLFWYQERWALPNHALVVNRFAFHPHRTDAIDWYVETDLVEIKKQMWYIRDGYLDVYVHDGIGYELEDAGELAEGIVNNDLPLAEAIEALRSLDRVCVALRANGCSGHALQQAFAPTLPASMLVRDASGVFSKRA
jgi:predicted RNA-binding protein associated with RNAse of E/G family